MTVTFLKCVQEKTAHGADLHPRVRYHEWTKDEIYDIYRADGVLYAARTRLVTTKEYNWDRSPMLSVSVEGEFLLCPIPEALASGDKEAIAAHLKAYRGETLCQAREGRKGNTGAR